MMRIMSIDLELRTLGWEMFFMKRKKLNSEKLLIKKERTIIKKHFITR